MGAAKSLWGTILDAPTQLTIDAAGKFVTITQGFHTLVPAGGTTETLSSIQLGSGISNLFGTGLPFVILKAAPGCTITITHDPSPSAGEFFLANESNFILTGPRLLKLYYVDTFFVSAVDIDAPTGGFIGATSPAITTPSFSGLETAVAVYKFAGINALSGGQTILVPSRSSKRFVPTAGYIELANVSGAGTPPLSVRLGSNGSWSNVVTTADLAPLTTQFNIFDLTLNSPHASVDVGSTGVSIDIQTPATGFATYSINAYLLGFYR